MGIYIELQGENMHGDHMYAEQKVFYPKGPLNSEQSSLRYSPDNLNSSGREGKPKF